MKAIDERTSAMTKRMETRDSKIQDGGDVDDMRSPGCNIKVQYKCTNDFVCTFE